MNLQPTILIVEGEKHTRDELRRLLGNDYNLHVAADVAGAMKRPRARAVEVIHWRMGGDSNPRCLSAHTLSRRAQSTTLSPIRFLIPARAHNRNRAWFESITTTIRS